MENKNKIGIIGASGFVGTHLLKRMGANLSAIAMTRTRPKALPEHIEWRQLDLFSHRSTVEALKGVDTAIYLVHSMMPSSHLFQGTFHDTDLLLADNFARACLTNQVKHIIYLSGLMPEGYASPHLQSRNEVEDVFKATQIPVTVLRAGMIVGPGGSSFEILKNLVQKLPFMVLPAWTQNTTQALFIDDIVDVLIHSVENENFKGQTLDVVTGEKINYEDLLRQMAIALRVKRKMFSVPIHSNQFSKLWVQIFGNSTSELVSPLIDSLLCSLPQVSPSPLVLPLIRYRTFLEMALESLKRDGGKRIARPKRKTIHDKSVRSIQRLVGVPSKNAQWIAHEYMNWIPRFVPFLIRVNRSSDQKSIRFYLSFLPWPLLVLSYMPGAFEDDRQKFHITGGWLSKTTITGWLEFRQVMNKTITLAAIHEFVPALPWPMYVLTQAKIHKLAMKRFDEHLKEKGKEHN